MAATTEKPKHDMEKHFAQHLASNEKKIRDRAVKKLSKWMKARSGKESGFDQEEMLRIWKGLYYCMWMSDKMLVQEDLADSLSEMVHNFQTPEQGLMYFETFLITMRREWYGIDYLRADKYFMLYRRIFRQTLILLKKQGWEESMFKDLIAILERHPLQASKATCPDGLRFFLLDIYIEEISRIGGEELTREQVLAFLEPLVKLASRTNVQSLTSSIMVTIFEEIVNQAWLGLEEEEDEEEEVDEEKQGVSEEMMIFESFEEKNKAVQKEGVKVFEELPMLEFDHLEIKNLLLKYASQPDIQSRNRRRMYKTIFLYRNLLNGFHPSKLIKDDTSERRDDEFLKVDNPKLAEKLKLRKQQSKERKKRRRQQKRQERQALLGGGSGKKEVTEGNNNQEDGEEEDDSSAKSKNKEEGGGGDSEDHAEEEETIEEMDEVEIGAAGADQEDAEERRTTRGARQESGSREGSDVIPRRKSKRKSKASKEEENEKLEGSAEEIIIIDEDERVEAARNEEIPAKQRKTKRKSARGKEGKRDEDEGAERTVMSEDAKEPEEIVVAERKTPRRRKSKRMTENEDGVEEKNVEEEEEETKKNETGRGLQQQQKRSKRKSAVSREDDTGLDMTELREEIETEFAQMQEEREEAMQEDGAVSKQAKRGKRKSTAAALKDGKTGRSSDEIKTVSSASKTSAYTPPTLRKRVKIALAKNEELPSTDYHKRVRASPGIPFDGEKKPESPAIKAIPATPRTLRSRRNKKK
ncbi:uncharacterized protein [Apostichopus japonicus]|uniref:uncharacterized protein n=1 Tax=Stichopus japonicus TaxID=307972 RepID=UPI003AB43334